MCIGPDILAGIFLSACSSAIKNKTNVSHIWVEKKWNIFYGIKSVKGCQLKVAFHDARFYG